MQKNYYNNQIAVQLDEQTIIKNIIVNTYKDIDLKVGDSIVRLFSDENQQIFFEQFSETKNHQVDLGKRVVLNNNQTAMMFMIREEKYTSLFAFSLGEELIKLFDELVEINNEQIQSIRDLYQKLSKHKDESKILEEIMLVNNSLINTRRELSNKNKKLKNLNLELEKMNNTDYLTKVPNRRKFFNDLNNDIKEDNLILTMMDFNNFKYINDNFGHDKGDDLLCDFTKLLEDLLSEYDGKLYRLGGDEFAILAKEKTNLPIHQIFNSVNKEIKKDYPQVSLSYGLVQVDKTEEDLEKEIEKYMRNADKKMYQMKSAFYDSNDLERKTR